MPAPRLLPVLFSTLLLLVAACSSPGATTSAPSSPSPTADDRVVVALDDFAALNLLALGVTPDVAYDAFGYATSAAVFAEAGITPRQYGVELNLEELTATDPDVIVGVSLPSTVEQQDALERLGAVTILDYQADWQTSLRATAQAVGREDRARRIEERVAGNAARLTQDLATAGRAGAVVSVLAGSEDGPFSPPVATNLGALLTELGLDRPTAQQAEVSAAQPFVNVSDERLPDHDGDVLYLMAGQTYPLAGLQQSPLYPRLTAVREGRAYEVSGEMWFGANPVSVQWVLDDVRATLLDSRPPQAEAEAGARLRDLVAATA